MAKQKISKADCVEIARRYVELKETQQVIAAAFAISTVHVGRVVAREMNWKRGALAGGGRAVPSSRNRSSEFRKKEFEPRIFDPPKNPPPLTVPYELLEGEATYFWGFVHKLEGENACWEWQGTLSQYGYGTFQTIRGLEKAHRVVWRLTYGPPPEGKYGCHTCDNCRCVRPSHVCMWTPQENAQDAAQKGHYRGLNGAPNRKGENNACARLTWEIVAEIRRNRFERGLPHKVSSEKYGITVAMISRIINNQAWRLEDAPK